MNQRKNLIMGFSLFLSVILLAAGCGGTSRQPSPPVDSLASQPSAQVESSVPSSSDQQPEASSSTSEASSQEPSSVKEIKACDLLTREEVAPVIGGEMWGPPELLRHGGGLSECMFQYVDNRIFVRYQAGTSSFEYVKMMDKGEAIPDVGDEAYWYSVSKTLQARVKGNTLEIQMSFPDDFSGDLKSAAADLAKKAATRM